MTDPLPSWNESAAKRAILAFVSRVTTASSEAFVPTTERIATFDNDGTLWLEKPAYIQVLHGLRTIGRMAAEEPKLRHRQPFKAVYEKDAAWLAEVADDYAAGDSSAYRALAAAFAQGCEGMTVEAFQGDVIEFLSTERDARKQARAVRTVRGSVS